MATYYVRTDGNDSNTGLGPATNQAWQTISKALGATGIGSGDTLYVAPGDYRQIATITVGGTYSAVTSVIGDPTGSQFSGITPGRVLITNRLSNDLGNTAGTFAIFTLVSKNYLRFSNFIFEQTANAATFYTENCLELRWLKCWFQHNSASSNSSITSNDTPASGNLKNYYITQCVFTGWSTGSMYSDSTLGRNSPASNWTYNLYIDRCVCLNAGSVTLLNGSNLQYSGTGFYISNSTGIQLNCNNLRGGLEVINCVGAQTSTWFALGVSAPGVLNNCTCFATNGFTGYTITNLRTAKYSPFNVGIERLWGLPQKDWFSADGLYSYATGTTTNAPTVDIYDVAWAGGTPNIGSYNNYTTTIPGQYNPTERNASTITIAPGSTFQSIELYLGATGLTASTSGLSARYNRTRTASVSIPLVARTIAQAWTAGGFAEVDATNMPGVYRLDVPDDALAAGADDVTIVVRGASGTNGSVMTIKLSSGGLTSAQTAAAVWGASPAGYNDATTFGGVVNQIDQTVTGIDTQVQDVAGNVWDELKANHTIPNSFGDYLDTKVSTGADTSRIQLRQGPFLIKQNAIDSVITEVNQFLSTVPNIEMVLIDSSGGSVSVAGATLVMRVRNQAGTAVVNNVTPTVAYADGGVIRWSPNLSWTALGVTTAGTYRIVVERTMSGVTTTFGPFLVQLSSG